MKHRALVLVFLRCYSIRCQQWPNIGTLCAMYGIRLKESILSGGGISLDVSSDLPMSAFRPISSALPPGADLPGGAAVRLLLTLRRRST